MKNVLTLNMVHTRISAHSCMCFLYPDFSLIWLNIHKKVDLISFFGFQYSSDSLPIALATCQPTGNIFKNMHVYPAL